MRTLAMRTLGFALAAWIFSSTAAFAQAPMIFPSAEEAVEELVAAAAANDADRIERILGADAKRWIESGDAHQDAEDRQHFVAAYAEKHVLEAPSENRRVLAVGNDTFPLAIPLTKQAKGWRFDPAAGREEMLNRRIGRNEVYAVQTLRAVVDAQQEYVRDERDGVRQYARHFLSTPGKRDGLYWPATAGEAQSPLGPLVGAASADRKIDVEAARAAPYHGYHYRMLTAQGSHAQGGAYDYLAGDKLIGGFAVVAYPARYGVSGVKTFMIDYAGNVVERDLGTATEKLARAIRAYDPEPAWIPYKE